ncbi:chemotaxis protein CheA [Marispirochaeta sp.]|jgi:two-component system, chemotaxis family, sensor kinase CheA|uniref:chemotaxis protein CheA n=1 Tax=Marispirochaeta sp. TaxID=2038653 RepID=UPI0029C7AA18|nr:chemotaxis protein CheA [Marispirochaeta sp.]
MSDYLDPNNEELLKDFFMEANMQVEVLEQNILVLENDPTNKDAVDEIFRAAHTLKGGAATVQMNDLASFTHLVEDLLDEIRNGSVQVSEDLIDVLLSSIDIIKGILDARSGGEEYNGDTEETRRRLKSFSTQESPAPAAEPEMKKPAGAASVASVFREAEGGSELSEYEILELQDAVRPGEKVYEVAVYFDEENPMNTVGGIQLYAAIKAAGTVLKTVPDFEELYEDQFHPRVIYYVATEETPESLQVRVDIPDVVKEVSLSELSTGAAKDKPKAKAKPKKQSAPSAAAAQPSAPNKTAEKEPESLSGDLAGTAEPQAARKGKKLGSVLRVDSARIDNLLNLVSEAVINKATFNQITTQFTETQEELSAAENLFRERMREILDLVPNLAEELNNGVTEKDIRNQLNDRFADMANLFETFEDKLKAAVNKFRGTSQNLGRLTGDLHERVLQIRMVPISQIFSRFPRLVRDISKSLNKRIQLVIEGEDTELDKSVIEDLLDPLIHCVRNSVDHGIESIDDRKAAGKEEEGHILLSAKNEGNMIVIEIHDDGKGIDVESVRSKAIERGIIHPSKNLSDIEAYNLIFEPGFSTAKSVTNISGRGVGLDVVRKQIEKLNGNVSVWSEKGMGTKFTIKLPLTLAIIQGLLVQVGEEIYAIPITSVIDSHRIKPDEIKMIDNYEVFNVREDVISLLRLNRLFKIQTSEQRDYQFVVIVGSGDKKMGLMVDTLIGEEDVVIKPLRDSYTNAPGIAGATILGDGTVSLIIDVSQLLELGFRQEMADRQKREATIG